MCFLKVGKSLEARPSRRQQCRKTFMFAKKIILYNHSRQEHFSETNLVFELEIFKCKLMIKHISST